MKNQEHLFCLYYSQLLNPKQAAIKAGFPPLELEQTALKLLQRKDISKKISDIIQKMQSTSSKQKAIAGLEHMAFGSINDCVKLMFCEEDFSKSQIDELDLFQISEIKRPKDGSLEIKFCDRFRAIEKLLELSDNDESSESMGDFYSALMQSADTIRKQG